MHGIGGVAGLPPLWSQSVEHQDRPPAKVLRHVEIFKRLVRRVALIGRGRRVQREAVTPRIGRAHRRTVGGAGADKPLCLQVGVVAAQLLVGRAFPEIRRAAGVGEQLRLRPEQRFEP